MKTHTESSVSMPPALLAEVRAAAQEEHRPADELVRDAVQHYLQTRHPHRDKEPPRKNLAQLLRESPFAGAELDLERRRDYPRPPEL